MKTKKIVIELFLLIFTSIFFISCSKDKEPITPPTSISGNNNINNPSSGTVTDVDGNVYNTIVIGTQEWMTENLRTTKYCNGDPIPNVTNDTQWGNLTSGAWTHYNNDNQFEIPYGKLYNWYAVDNVKNICPCGWHVPTDTEWTVLANNISTQPSILGGKMKSIGTQYWLSPNTSATNESGFSGLPSGSRFYNGFPPNIGEAGFWWSSTESSTPNYAWYRYLVYNDGYLYRNNSDELSGFSIRCVKD